MALLTKSLKRRCSSKLHYKTSEKDKITLEPTLGAHSPEHTCILSFLALLCTGSNQVMELLKELGVKEFGHCSFVIYDSCVR